MDETLHSLDANVETTAADDAKQAEQLVGCKVNIRASLEVEIDRGTSPEVRQAMTRQLTATPTVDKAQLLATFDGLDDDKCEVVAVAEVLELVRELDGCAALATHLATSTNMLLERAAFEQAIEGAFGLSATPSVELETPSVEVKMEVDVEMPSVEVEVDIKGKGGFGLGGGIEVGADVEVDVEVEMPSVEVDVEVEMPSVEVEVEMPSVEVDVEVEIPSVEVEVEIPSVEVEVEMPSVEVHVEVEMPSVDVEVEMPSIELELEMPSVKVDISAGFSL